jgi:hypothetical protein
MTKMKNITTFFATSLINPETSSECPAGGVQLVGEKGHKEERSLSFTNLRIQLPRLRCWRSSVYPRR